MSTPRLALFTWRTARPGQLAHLHELRHRVFIQRAAYDVPSYDGMEYDQFDTPACTYALVTWRGRGVGCWRAIPTTQPFLLPVLWPEAIPLPRGEYKWEISRFGVDNDLSVETRRTVAALLVRGLVEHALAEDVDEYWFLSSPRAMRYMLPRTEIQEMTGVRAIGRSRVAVMRIRCDAKNLNQTLLEAEARGATDEKMGEKT